jgi:hypothetical protein
MPNCSGAKACCCVMDVFAESGLHKVNICRLHLQVLTIADITEGCGEQLTWNAWQGHRALPHINKYKCSLQPRPPESFWAVWQRAIASLCGRERRLLQPLGHWTEEGCKHWIWWYDECTESLFWQMGESSIWYHKNPPVTLGKQPGGSRNHLKPRQTSQCLPHRAPW